MANARAFPVLRHGAERRVAPQSDDNPSGGHCFDNINLSDNARAIFGDVYASCSDLINQLTPAEERRGMTRPQLAGIRRLTVQNSSRERPSLSRNA